MRARYYSAEAGVFLSTDPVKNIGPGWKSIPFAYANGNPYRYSDPDGNFAQVLLGAAVGMVVGFTSEVVVQGASALSGGRFDWDEVVTSTAAAGLGGAAATLNPAAGGAVSEVYREYIKAVSKGEIYSLQDGVIDALLGGGKAYLRGKLFDKFVPKISLSGGNYFGEVRGANPSTLKGAFTGSHFLNDDLVKGIFDLARDTTSAVLGNRNTANQTVDAFIPPSILNPKQETGPSGPGGNSGINGGASNNSGGSSPPPQTKPTTTYTVRRGDTLGDIAYRYNTTANALGALNGIKDLNLIYPGQVLRIPGR